MSYGTDKLSLNLVPLGVNRISMLLLMPGEDASLHGLKTTSETGKDPRAMLNAKEVHLAGRDT